jgi:hypothetical protein
VWTSDLPGLDRRRAGRQAARPAAAGAALTGAASGAAPLIAAAVVACGLLAAPPAAATTYCVGVERAGCEQRATAAQAFADANDDGDRVELGAVTATSALASDRAIAVVGSGEDETVLRGGLTLSAAGAELSGATVHGLELRGTASRVDVEGVAELHGGAILREATVRGTGGVDAAEGTPRLETVLLDLTGGPGLRVRCGTTLQARHVTLVGRPDAAVTTLCDTSAARFRDSILWGAPGTAFAGPGAVATDHSDYRPVAGHATGAGDRHVDPGFAPGGARLAAGSPLVDAGSPGVLADAEWPEDRAGLPRIADGNGDGTPARDPGAYELAPAAVPLPTGNLLGDPGAEDGGAWTLTGSFARERYGAFPFPSTAAGFALGAGGAFFAGGERPARSPGVVGSARQTVDVTRLAPEIDLGKATASLSGLFGGYRADGDSGAMRVAFLDPAGAALSVAELDTPAASERANATTLLPRSRDVAVPRLARQIEVTLQARLATGIYSDAYFDNLALTVGAPGAPPPPHDAKPFAGVRVLTGSATVDRKGRIAMRLACVHATVGGCTGVVTVVGALKRKGKPVRVGMAALALARGTTRHVRTKLRRRARRAVRQRRRIRMTVYAAARDGQGLTRTSTVPLTVRSRAARLSRGN